MKIPVAMCCLSFLATWIIINLKNVYIIIFIILFITIPTLILQNLADDLKSEFSGKIEEAIVSLMMLPECYDAVSLHDAMSVSFLFWQYRYTATMASI